MTSLQLQGVLARAGIKRGIGYPAPLHIIYLNAVGVHDPSSQFGIAKSYREMIAGGNGKYFKLNLIRKRFIR